MEWFSNKKVQGARIFNTLTINDQLKLLNDICCGKDKCLEKKIPIVRPDRNIKYFNLNKKCQLTNYGPPMEKVFMNPTVFTLP